MSAVWLLLKVQFKTRFSLREMTSVRSGGRSGTLKRAAMALLFAFLFVYLIAVYTLLLNMMLTAAIEFEYPQIVMDLVVLCTMVLTAIFGIFIVLSNIFLARDSTLLSSLPVSGRQIFLSKFLFVYLSEAAISALFILPAVILYAVKVEGAMGIGIFLRALYVILLSPMLPLLVATLLVSALMLIIGRLRRRDLFITVGSFVMLAALMIGQFAIQSKMQAAAMTGNDFFADLFKNSWTTMNSLSVPPFSWASFGIHGGGVTSLLSLICFTILSLMVFFFVWLISGAIYKYAVSVNSEARKKSKAVKAGELSAGSASPRAAIFKKEWRVLFRTPVYVTNSLSGAAIALILLLTPVFSDGFSAVRALIAELPSPIVALALAGIIVFFSSLNMGASTVVSREGRAFEYLRSLPVEPRDLYAAKLLFGVSLCLFWAVPLSIGAVPAFGVSVPAALCGFVLGMLGSALVSVLGAWVDFVRPKLAWINETEAMKQNMNGMLAMLIAIGLTLLFAGGVYLLFAKTSFAPWAILALCAAVLVAACALAVSAALKAGEKAYGRSE